MWQLKLCDRETNSEQKKKRKEKNLALSSKRVQNIEKNQKK